MSLVGPRPDVPYSVRCYLPWQRRRLETNPGLTGLWQVSGKNKTTFRDMVRLDIKYTKKRSFWGDLRILVLTIPSILDQVVRKTLKGKQQVQ
jgi:lipopolysaccharide/colanic/teichoic acid biosynthesis glycosyltransferase